jgi:folate-binding protein YgfZ
MTLRAIHSASAQSALVAGRPVVLHYTDTSAEYHALVTASALIDRSHRHRMHFEGGGAADALNGLVTNDVSQLVPGKGLYAAALSPKGKVVADLRILCTAPGVFLVDTSARAATGWFDVVRKYVNPRMAKYRNESEAVLDLGVFGPGAAAALAAVIGVDADALAAVERHSHIAHKWKESSLTIVANGDLSVAGFDIMIPAALADSLSRALLDAGVVPAGHEAWEIGRIEQGTPEWGIDIDDATLAQEANLDRLHAISYTKGCYTGQETVARVHFRGHVNRHLRQLRFVCPVVPPQGTQLIGDEDKVVGDVRSSTHSPRVGGVAIAMIRREVEPGASVTIRWDGQECQAGVHDLPLEQN